LLTTESARSRLTRFRESAIQQFPFVACPTLDVLETVRTDTPLLFLTIMATMMFEDPSLQRQLGEEARSRLFQAIVLRAECRLEHLQSLLIYAAWYCYFFKKGEYQVFLISQLCVSLAYDLGIATETPIQSSDLTQSVDGTQNKSLRNAQMRAFLGTYCLSTL
jgi:hypothetical protein